MATERNVKIFSETKKVVSKKMPSFYNPVMVHNRDISILILKALSRKKLQICDALAGTGIRTLRFLRELPKSSIKEIHANDHSKSFSNNLNKAIIENGLENKKILITQDDANLMLLKSSGFDYIDIDPFGSPNPFLDSAIRRLSRNGILAITATDTSSLAGTYPKVCKRNYWAIPLHNFLMHEIGLRILIRKIQLIGSQYEKALIPIFSYSKDHYYRTFLMCHKSKSKCNEVLMQHRILNSDDLPMAGTNVLCGPAWCGGLFDEKLAAKVYKLSAKNYNDKILNIFLEKIMLESKCSTLGFYCNHQLAKRLRIGSPPSIQRIFDKINKKGFAAPTHFSPIGFRTNAKKEEIEKIVFSLQKPSKGQP